MIVEKKIKDFIRIISPVENDIPLIITSPHSGRNYDIIDKNLLNVSLSSIQALEDSFVDFFLENVDKLGIHSIINDFPRAILDVNRNSYEIDATMFNEKISDKVIETENVVRGIGLFIKKNRFGEDIYKSKLDLNHFKFLKEFVYDGWHNVLSSSLENIYEKNSKYFLIDLHSMPSGKSLKIKDIPDICIGNLKGESCDNRITEITKEFFISKSYKVRLNNPYSGGFITKQYSNSYINKNVLQIEISRDLYMDESNLELINNFYKVRDDFFEYFSNISKFLKTDYQKLNVA